MLPRGVSDGRREGEREEGTSRGGEEGRVSDWGREGGGREGQVARADDWFPGQCLPQGRNNV